MGKAMNTINLEEIGKRAKAASVKLARLTSDEKTTALLTIADALEANRAELIATNALDIAAAQDAGMDPLYIRDRLNLERRMDSMIADLRKVAELPDPVGQEYEHATLENGLKIFKRRTPLGVMGVIYEARPQVTVDVASLALKTGNAVILRGGKEVLRTNLELVRILSDALASVGIPGEAISFINSPDRQLVGEMLRQHEYIDIIIPRGGSSLHKFCRENSTIPVITGGIGICHLYVDSTAKLDDALAIIHNAKTQSPAVCNALDTLLVDSQIAADFLPRVVEHLGKDGVSFKADTRAFGILTEMDNVDTAGPDDFDTEWYALILGLKVVDSLDEAIEHIREHSTQHSDGILTQNMADGERFLNEVDSAVVYLNASTRFTDGSAMGLGAEIAVSTQKLHARGPMALKELTTYKWIIIGEGHSRA